MENFEDRTDRTEELPTRPGSSEPPPGDEDPTEPGTRAEPRRSEEGVRPHYPTDPVTGRDPESAGRSDSDESAGDEGV